MSRELDWETVVNLVGVICGLEEDEITDNHPDVAAFRKAIEKFEIRHGPTACSLVMKSELCFSGASQRARLLTEAWNIVRKTALSEIRLILEAAKDFKEDATQESFEPSILSPISKIENEAQELLSGSGESEGER